VDALCPSAFSRPTRSSDKSGRKREAEEPRYLPRRQHAKLLASINEIAFKRIPADPTDKRYRQGSTLGDDYKHWFRDKFGNGRFRLFFRFDSKAKLIIYAWVNDEDSKRTYGSKNDAYAVFKKMLDAGNPPDSWDKLLSQCSSGQLAEVISKAGDL
jgi:toxin YhaV